MTDKLEKLLQNKNNYLNRLIRAFKPIHPVSEFSKPTPTIPRAFTHITPDDIWVNRPQSMLPLFQKMILSIKKPEERLTVITNLVKITDIKSQSAQRDEQRERLQKQIFRAITGHPYYGVPLYPDQVDMQDIKTNDFFKLIFMGICAYENTAPEKREKFNTAVMPDVKKQNIVIPYRLQQYSQERN